MSNFYLNIIAEREYLKDSAMEKDERFQTRIADGPAKGPDTLKVPLRRRSRRSGKERTVPKPDCPQPCKR